MSLETKRFYDFGDFRVDTVERILLRDGKYIPVTPKVFETLWVFLENAGRIIDKDELLSKIWQDHFVEESSLTFNIKMLRKALGDSATQPKFIETVPRRGYRFIATVQKISGVAEFPKAAKKDAREIKKHFAPHRRKTQKYLVLIPALAVLIISFCLINWRSSYSKNSSYSPILNVTFSVEKISNNGTAAHPVISPDGKRIVYVDLSGGKSSVWLKEITTSNNIEIVPASDDIYNSITFSPDGNFLYLSRREKGRADQANAYRLSIFGGTPIQIINDAQGWMSISPDGRKISFVRCHYQADEFCSLWIADAADGKNEQKFFSRPSPIHISDNRFSPDGKTVAFVVGQTENSANECGIAEVDLATGAESDLSSQKFFNIINFVFLPGNDGLLAAARKITDGNFRIWHISTSGDQAEPLTKDSESYASLSIDSIADSLVATQIKTDFHLLLGNTENSSEPRLLSDALKAKFTPTGKIVYSSAMSGNFQIWITNPDSSEKRQLTSDKSDNSNPLFSPDNSAIYFSSNRTGEIQVWRMNADGSNQIQLTGREGGIPLFVTPDEHWLYYQSSLHKTLWRVPTDDAARGVDKEGNEQLLLDKEAFKFAISPDGTQVAYRQKPGIGKQILVTSISDGQVVRSFNYPDGKGLVLEISWTSDGKNLVYISSDNEYKNNTLWKQPISQEPPQKLTDLGNDQISSFALAPDGKTFVVTEGNWKYDVALLHGLK